MRAACLVLLMILPILGAGCAQQATVCEAPARYKERSDRAGPYVGHVTFSENVTGVHVHGWACLDDPPRRMTTDCHFLEWSFGVVDEGGNWTDPRPLPMANCSGAVTRVVETAPSEIRAHWDRTVWHPRGEPVSDYEQVSAPPGNYTVVVRFESLRWTHVTRVA
jgi:hypothetical protein